MSLELYSKVLQRFLQSKIVIKCDNKILRSGKLSLFNIKQYFIKFYIENDKKATKILELPYPYKITLNKDGGCTLNYRLTALCDNNTSSLSLLRSCKQSCSHRIYDNIVTIYPIK